MKSAGILSALAMAGAVMAKPCAPVYPTTTIAGIEVVDTPLVRAAAKLIQVFIPEQPYLYNHLMRTWLFGAAAINNNATLKAVIDPESQAIGGMLHDLGWDTRADSPWHSEDLPFEADSGLGAVAWIKENKDLWSTPWDDARLEKVFDGITLQATPNYLGGKNIQTVWIVQSVLFEFPGPKSPLLTQKQYDDIMAAYPNHYFYRGTNETFSYLAASKPEGTYGTFVEQFGTYNVPGYNASGHHAYDLITGAITKPGGEGELYPTDDAQSGSALGPGAAPLM